MLSEPLTHENAAQLARQYLGCLPGYPQERFAGRGIVTCAGGVRYRTCAWVLIRLLHQLGCDLPIEVWQLADEAPDESWDELVRPYGVDVRRAGDVVGQHQHPRAAGWALKSHAILNSRFQEVLFLDADNVPVRNPEFLFDLPEYRQPGAAFWPDGGRMPEDHPSWALFDVEYRDEPEFESGQMLIHKELAWRSLNLSHWYNQHSELFYDYIYGDKDTFRFAWHVAGNSFAMVPHSIRTAQGTIQQHDFEGRLLFQHRCFHKWSLRRTLRNPDFQLEDNCATYVEELKASWDPLKHLIDATTPDDEELERQHVGRRFRFVENRRSGGRITLGEGRIVYRSNKPSEEYWWFEDGKLVLTHDAASQKQLLESRHDGGWETASNGRSRTHLRLVPA